MNTDSSIGQSTLPSTCPVCEHSPVASEDCKPHKSLRTTIKVFLRTEEKKREALRLKEAKETPPDTPADSEPTPAAAYTPVASATPTMKDISAGEVRSEQSSRVDRLELLPPNGEDVAPPQKAQQDIPQPSIEVRLSPIEALTNHYANFAVGDCTWTRTDLGRRS